MRSWTYDCCEMRTDVTKHAFSTDAAMSWMLYALVHSHASCTCVIVFTHPFAASNASMSFCIFHCSTATSSSCCDMVERERERERERRLSMDARVCCVCVCVCVLCVCALCVVVIRAWYSCLCVHARLLFSADLCLLCVWMNM